MHPHRALQQVRLRRSESSLRTGSTRAQTPPGSAATVPRAPLCSGSLGALPCKWDLNTVLPGPLVRLREGLRTWGSIWSEARPIPAVAESKVCIEVTPYFFSLMSPAPIPSKECLPDVHREMESSRPSLSIPGYHRIITSLLGVIMSSWVDGKMLLFFGHHDEVFSGKSVIISVI